MAASSLSAALGRRRRLLRRNLTIATTAALCGYMVMAACVVLAQASDEKVAQFLESKFPELQGRISGDLYPPPPTAVFLTHILSALQLFGIAWMIFGGESLLRMLPMYKNPARPLPSWYFAMRDNSMPLAIFLFLLAPQMIGGMQNNGAFEVLLNTDVVVHSRLDTGRFPTVDDLIDPLVAAGLRMAQ